MNYAFIYGEISNSSPSQGPTLCLLDQILAMRPFIPALGPKFQTYELDSSPNSRLEACSRRVKVQITALSFEVLCSASWPKL